MQESQISLNFIRYHCEKNNVTVENDFSSQLPSILIDRNRIEQVIIDVALNAVHAMAAEGGRLIARTSCRKVSFADVEWLQGNQDDFSEGEELVIVDVEDSGPGIPGEYLDKVFDPFFTTRRASGGVGLGLSIARTIIKNHRGVILLMNLPHKGARARLVFKTH